MTRSNRVVYVWEKIVKFISYCTTLATVKCEGWDNLMVWGCMGWNNMGILIEVEEKINAHNIVRFWVIEWCKFFQKLKIVVGEQYFQQDNDLKHASKKATQLF